MSIESSKVSRRRVLGLAAGALVAAPIMLVSREAWAGQNAPMRKALQYQDSPKGAAHCAKCVQFIPGKTATDKGQCKAIAGDTEISPNGWCAAFVAKAA